MPVHPSPAHPSPARPSPGHSFFITLKAVALLGLDRPHWRSDRGQATTEYALVLLAAALVGVLVIGWATAGGGAAAVGRLFDTVIESAIEQL
ncbi:MAG TPA: hypothetical protein VMM60_02270 [Ilumatobacter sp.]|nr:hypothetical protein [Ilumatobacter sp.]